MALQRTIGNQRVMSLLRRQGTDLAPSLHSADSPGLQRKTELRSDHLQAGFLEHAWKEARDTSSDLQDLDLDATVLLTLAIGPKNPDHLGTTKLAAEQMDPAPFAEWMKSNAQIDLVISEGEPTEMAATVIHETYIHVIPKYHFIKANQRIIQQMEATEDEKIQEELFHQMQKLLQEKADSDEHKSIQAWYGALVAALKVGVYERVILDAASDRHLGVPWAVKLEGALKNEGRVIPPMNEPKEWPSPIEKRYIAALGCRRQRTFVPALDKT